MIEAFLLGVLLSFIAGLSTSIGGLVAFFYKDPGPKFLSMIMGLSAGVMLFVSFAELLQDAIVTFDSILIGSLFFFLGMGIMFAIDIMVSHRYHFQEDYFKKECTIDERLTKASIFVFLGIFIHNLPEGLATVVGTIDNIEIGVILTIAIALHNIPEGIAVAIPTCESMQSKKKGFFWAFLSGMSEPLGAIVFGLIFLPFITPLILSALLAVVAGIMVYVSIDELLPVSHCFGNEKWSIIGIVVGMFVMALSLAILEV
ncbi:MAG: Zinc transporter ZupT [Promethearchaeota archaeon]|nr:MAG: Zinc transporter ZupT [Candidatus Lokiarchaeota archaeon]